MKTNLNCRYLWCKIRKKIFRKSFLQRKQGCQMAKRDANGYIATAPRRGG